MVALHGASRDSDCSVRVVESKNIAFALLKATVPSQGPPDLVRIARER